MRIESVLMIATVSVVIGLAKGGLGPVMGALATPLLSQVMPVSQAVATALPLLMLGDVFALRAYWGDWDMRTIRLLIPAAVLGILAGTYLLAELPDSVLRPALGTFSLLIAAYKLASDRLTTVAYQPRGWHSYLAGATSGFGSAVANAGGPPFTAYMLLQSMSPRTFIGTTTLFFALVNLIKLPGFVVTGLMDDAPLGIVLAVLPLLFGGVWLGRRFINWVDPQDFERVMIALLVAASVLLFVQ